MPPHQNSRGVRVFLHRRCHAIRQIFLERGIGYDRHAEGIQVRQSRTVSADPNTLDHLPNINIYQNAANSPTRSLTSYRHRIKKKHVVGSAIAIVMRPRRS